MRYVEKRVLRNNIHTHTFWQYDKIHFQRHHCSQMLLCLMWLFGCLCFWRCINCKVLRSYLSFVLLFMPFDIPRNIFFWHGENLWCNRIYALCYRLVSSFVRMLSPHLFECLCLHSLHHNLNYSKYCLAGKLDYLQDKCKHMRSPTSDCCSALLRCFLLSCHTINILHFALMPMALIFHTLNFASIDLIQATWCQCNFWMETITQITNWILQQQFDLHFNGFWWIFFHIENIWKVC